MNAVMNLRVLAPRKYLLTMFFFSLFLYIFLLSLFTHHLTRALVMCNYVCYNGTPSGSLHAIYTSQSTRPADHVKCTMV
jgi:hypothetical protein